MGAEKAAAAQAYVRELLAQKDPAYALILESSLNDELIERCQALSAFVREVAEAGGMAPWGMAERARKLLEEV